jgi:dynein axonemal assembly factor 1
MTPRRLRDLCQRFDLYMTPDVNDKLFLQLQGFRRIESLEKYTCLRVLYLETNAISKIEGLECCLDLRCLFLQENLIDNMEGLEKLVQLDTLNLSDNQIRCVRGLSTLARLNSLQLSRNRLDSADSIRGLLECPSIQVLDLSENRIDDPAAVLEVLCQMPKLGVLTLQGNPVIQKVENYRKTLVSRIKTLKHLDDRPVFQAERRTAEAWARGGREAEAEERKLITQEEEERDRRNFEAMERIFHGRNSRKLLCADGKLEHSTQDEASSAADSDGGSVQSLEGTGATDLNDVVITDLEAPGSDARDEGLGRAADKAPQVGAATAQIGGEGEQRSDEEVAQDDSRFLRDEAIQPSGEESDGDIPELEDDLDLLAELD